MPQANAAAKWTNLDCLLRLGIAKMCLSDRDVHALGSADLTLLPLLASDPSLLVRQAAYRKATNFRGGNALVDAVREHLLAFWASHDEFLFLRDDESNQVIAELVALRNGKGPVPILRVDQVECPARLVGLPDAVQVDLDISSALFRRRQPTLAVPARITCLFAHELTSPFEAEATRRVRGRHAYTAQHKLDVLRLSDLDLSRGRLDLSGLAHCSSVELFNCTLGKGDYGLRWPRTVTSLRMTGCEVEDQSAHFALPEGLRSVELCRTPLAMAANTWSFPQSVESLELLDSPVGKQLLPSALPAALRELYCTTANYAPQLRRQPYPSGIETIFIGHMDVLPAQPRRTKFSKRFWQKQLAAAYPSAKVRIS